LYETARVTSSLGAKLTDPSVQRKPTLGHCWAPLAAVLQIRAWVDRLKTATAAL
jgi:hypothetical protein